MGIPAKLKRLFRTQGRSLTLVVIILLMVLSLGAWATFAQIDELVRARGQVIAAARTQVIQAADNGVIAEILVEEGQPVNAGQLLIRFDQNRVRAAVDDGRNKVAALQAALARLQAEVYARPLQFPAELENWPAFRTNQSQLYERRRRALHEAIAALENSNRLVIQELALTEPLLISGDIGQTEVIRLRRAKVEIEGQIVNLRNKFFQDAQMEMTKVEEDLAAQEEILRERLAVLGFTELRSPVSGRVRKVSVSTIGATVRAGDALVEILPTSSELIVEAKFLPADVAALRLGLPSMVKLDAYDAAVYGSLEGVVSYISPDALNEPSPQMGEQFFYRVHIKIKSPKALGQRKPILVNAGMTATVEVRSRQRSVASYLTKPITRTFSDAFTER